MVAKKRCSNVYEKVFAVGFLTEVTFRQLRHHLKENWYINCESIESVYLTEISEPSGEAGSFMTAD